MNSLPAGLAPIVATLSSMDAVERCDYLMALADGAGRWAPKPGDHFDVSIVRKDPGCVDEIGMHLSVVDGRVHLAISLGANVQTLNRALAAVLCEGLQGATVGELEALEEGFIRDMLGADLVRQRARTVYVLLARLKEAVRALQPVAA